MAEPLFEAVPNVSEGRDGDVIGQLVIAAESPGSVLLDADADPEHNRLVLSLAGTARGVADAMVSLAAAATKAIDLGRHSGVHPRVGALDVVPIVPLGQATAEAAADLARQIATRIWDTLSIPVFLYGWSSEGGTRLADIRAGRVRPDLGGPDLHPTAGAVCVGARPPLVAYNVLLDGTDLELGREIARELRSGFGSRGVQALAFALQRGLQISTNVRDLGQAGPAQVLEEVASLAATRGLRVIGDEVVGLCPAASALPAASGRILEGRLGRAGIRLVARALRAAGREDTARAAGRLDLQEAILAELNANGDEILAAAEVCVAVIRMGAAVEPRETVATDLLLTAARGLRRALDAATLARHPSRVEALDLSLDADRGQRS